MRFRLAMAVLALSTSSAAAQSVAEGCVIPDGVSFGHRAYLAAVTDAVAARFSENAYDPGTEAQVWFRLRRDGSLDSLHLRKRASSYTMNMEAVGAIRSAAAVGAFGALPAEYVGETLSFIAAFGRGCPPSTERRNARRAPADGPFHALQVEKPAVAKRRRLPAPRYPPGLRDLGISGEVLVQLVIDTSGRVDTSSILVLKATHPEFIRAVRAVLPYYEFHPAEADGRRVPMYVQMPFVFTIERPDPGEEPLPPPFGPPRSP